MPKLEGPPGGHEGRGTAFAADLDLVRRARAGEPRARAELVERLRCVRRFLHHRNSTYGDPLDVQELEDTLQNTLLALWRKLDQYAGEGSLEAWAYRFSCLEVLKRIQAKDRRPSLLEDLREAPPEPQQTAPAPSEAERVYLALERLGEAADVLRLKHLEGLTFDQIAERLGLNANTARTRYYRAMERLRTLLSATESAGGGRP